MLKNDFQDIEYICFLLKIFYIKILRMDNASCSFNFFFSEYLGTDDFLFSF